MLLPRRTRLASVLIFALLAAGCGEIATTLGELMVVRKELVTKFGDEVTVNVTQRPHGLLFRVTFINSALNNQIPDARQKRAEEAAKIVQEKYSRIDMVREIWVGFVRNQTSYIVFHRSEMLSLHAFDKNAQPLAGRNRDQTQPASDTSVTAGYTASSDETDISVSGIQLEGKPGGLGLTVLPFFKVPGDARGRNGLAPKTVSLNFASYAEKPKFKQTESISFVADGKVVLKTEGTFSGNDAQFCFLNVTYPTFLSMVRGKELKIKLGDKEYLLTPSQLGSMRAMTDYVTK